MLAGEAVKRQVFVERANDVIAIRPDADRHVAVITNRVRVAHEIEPVHGQALAVVRRGQQLVHEFLVGLRVAAFLKVAHLFRRRRKPGEVERDAAEQGPAIGFRRRRETLFAQAIEDEGINRMRAAGGGRQLPSRWRTIRPMPVVFRPLRDPFLQQLLLPGGQLLAGLRRWHHLLGIGRFDPRDGFTFLRLARRDRGDVVLFRVCALLGVEPQLRLARLLVRPVAGEAVVREDWPDVAIELNVASGRRAVRHAERRQREEAQGPELSCRMEGGHRCAK